MREEGVFVPLRNHADFDRFVVDDIGECRCPRVEEMLDFHGALLSRQDLLGAVVLIADFFYQSSLCL